MGVSIRPDSWIFSWIKNKHERELRIADYLDEIAKEATHLANIWEEVVRSIESKGIANTKELEMWNQLLNFPKRAKKINGMQYSRLDEFYKCASSVLGNKHRDELDFVVFKIGNILKHRKLTRELVESEIIKLKKAKLFNDDTILNDNISLSDSVDIMVSEAGALHVSAKEFRAKI